MSGPQPSRKRPSAVHRRAGHARPLRHCYNKKRLFACSQNKKRAAPFAWGPRGMCYCSLLSLDSTSGANALASAAVNAGSCIDNSLVLHGDCANGAGVNTCTASNALAGNGMSHRELLISVLNL